MTTTGRVWRRSARGWMAAMACVLAIEWPARGGESGRVSMETKGWVQGRGYADLESDAEVEADASLDLRGRVESRLKLNGSDASAFAGIDLRGQWWDVEDEGELSVKLWEAFVELRDPDYAIGLGQQFVTWGKLDDVVILDRVSPQDYRWFILNVKQERKIPALMLKGGYYGDLFQLEGVALSLPDDAGLDYSGTDWAAFDHLYDVVAQGNYPPQAKALVGGIRVEETDPPDSPEFAVRLRTRKEDTDFSVYYMWIHDRVPGLKESTPKGRLTKQFLSMPTAENLMALAAAGVTAEDLALKASYARNQVIGFDFETVVGEYGVRGEFGYLSDQPYTAADFSFIRKDTFSGGVGLDHTMANDLYWNVQWVIDYIPNYEPMFITEDFAQMAVLNMSRDFLDGDVQVSLESSYRITYDDWMLHGYVSHKNGSGLRLKLGAYYFEGDPWTLFGRYDTKDLMYMEARYDF